MTASRNYSFQDVNMIIGGIPMFEVKDLKITKPNDKFSTVADNSTGNLTYIKNVAHRVMELTIACAQGGAGAVELSALEAAESTYPFAIYDTNGITTFEGECKVNFTDAGFTNEPTDVNFKLVGKMNARVIGVN